MNFIKLNEERYEIGDLVNCFYSFFFLNNSLFSVHRRHRLFSYDQWPKSQSDNVSQIILSEYFDKDPFRLKNERFLCNGNDPRVVSNGEQAFVLSEGAVHDPIRYRVSILPSNETLPIKLGDGVSIGKNWQPYVDKGQLLIVDSIAAF